MSKPPVDARAASSAEPAGPQPIASQAFREALSRFASGVTIVAVYDGSVPVGFTATGFTSVSLAPPLILVCIDRRTRVHDPVVRAPNFGVSILEECQSGLARRFAQPGIDRFCGVSLRAEAADRAPLIEGALATLVCRHETQHDAGDHTILVGEVLEAVVAAGSPLLHFARGFGAFVPGAAMPAPAGGPLPRSTP